TIADREAWRPLDAAYDARRGAVAWRGRILRRFHGTPRDPGRHLPGRQQLRFDGQPFGRVEPASVIAPAQVGDRVHALDGVSEGIEVGPAEADQLVDHAEHAPLPGRVKDRLVHLLHDRTESVHATHVVDAVHAIG